MGLQVINIKSICMKETPRTKTAHIQLDAQPTVVQQNMLGVIYFRSFLVGINLVV